MKVLVADVVVGFVIAPLICSSKASALKALPTVTRIVFPLDVHVHATFDGMIYNYDLNL